MCVCACACACTCVCGPLASGGELCLIDPVESVASACLLVVMNHGPGGGGPPGNASAALKFPHIKAHQPSFHGPPPGAPLARLEMPLTRFCGLTSRHANPLSIVGQVAAASRRTDVYAFAVTAWEILVGKVGARCPAWKCCLQPCRPSHPGAPTVPCGAVPTSVASTSPPARPPIASHPHPIPSLPHPPIHPPPPPVPAAV